MAKIKKDDNIKQVRDVLRARNISFELKDNWTHLIALLKKDEGDNKYFPPKQTILPSLLVICSTQRMTEV